jgi:signal transduction histidine kinase
MIANVLDFSRIEQGRQEYDFLPTDIVRLVEETVKVMQHCAAERSVRLDLRLPPSPDPRPNPFLDGRCIQQALVNLLDNAIKHSSPGQVVTVQLEFGGSGSASRTASASGILPPAAPSSPLVIAVEDHGPGIPREEQNKIFERFYRCGSELRRETPGVGIGLSIVQHVVEAHGGRIEVDSEVGRGSRFAMVLPLNRSPEETIERT